VGVSLNRVLRPVVHPGPYMTKDAAPKGGVLKSRYEIRTLTIL